VKYARVRLRLSKFRDGEDGFFAPMQDPLLREVSLNVTKGIAHLFLGKNYFLIETVDG